MTGPIDKVENLAAEAERGRSERTPWLILGGVSAIVAAFIGVVLAIVFAVYLLG